MLSALNDEQRLAVTHPGGPALVIAGAGSGKTRVLTHRIAHLISGGIPARCLFAATFTNKAAGEMKARVEHLCGPQPDLWIGTFHAMCNRILRLEISRLGMNGNFTIVDQDDRRTVLKEVLAQLKLDDKVYRPNALREQIARAKNRLLSPEQFRASRPDISDAVTADVYRVYQRKLFQNNALDFDDLLMATVKLLAQDADVRAKYNERFLHVLVDEYQDTNHAQYQLIRLLAGPSRNVFAVGDEDQSIYGFRGAEIHNILDFERDFPKTKLYRLEQNYRSTQNILAAANALIRNNRQRKGKTLWTQNGDGERVQVFQAQDEREEVRFILDTLEILVSERGASLEDCVIFYRIHALSRVLEEGLRERGIPYEILGGVGFYERREIKDALAYLRVLANPADSIALTRIANVPARGIGPSTLSALQELARANQISLEQAMEQAVSQGSLGRKASQGVRKLLVLLGKGTEERDVLRPYDLLAWVLEESGYLAELRAEKTIESKTRLENLKELSSAIQEFEQENPAGKLEEFLNGVALWTDLDSYENADRKVTLMSLHSSKGLEFPYVFIAGLEEGIFPYAYGGFEAEDLEEERRLLYVGITRARERLFLSCTNSRLLFGNRKYLEPSRFLSEMRGDFMQEYVFTPRYESLYDSFQEKESAAEEPVVLIHSQAPAWFDLQTGQRIIHPKFGTGKILDCFDKGENLKLSIQFQSEEHPRLLAAKYANLQKAVDKN